MQSGREHLRDWIQRRGVNQAEAAAILGVHDVFVSQILSGVRGVGLANAVKFERLTGIPAESWLLNAISPRRPPTEGRTSNRKLAKR
jgi:plasmid maintenance system antidote protein VapI